MRCPHCGARITADAQWCGRCLARLQPDAPAYRQAAQTTTRHDGAAPTPEVAAQPQTAAPPGPTYAGEYGYHDANAYGYAPVYPDVGNAYAPAPDSGWYGSAPSATSEVAAAAGPAEPGVQAWDTAGAQPPDAYAGAPPVPNTYPATERGRIGEHALVTFVDGSPGWRCAICEGMQRLEVTNCETCATSLFSSEKAPSARPTGDPAKALLWSIIPGGGQWYVGEKLLGVARFVLVALVFAAAISFPSEGAMAAMRIVLLVVGVVLWAVCAYDARLAALGAPDDALLGGRRLVWATAGVLALLVAMAFLALAMGALSSPQPPA